jgi:hypothetical protein
MISKPLRCQYPAVSLTPRMPLPPEASMTTRSPGDVSRMQTLSGLPLCEMLIVLDMVYVPPRRWIVVPGVASPTDLEMDAKALSLVPG